ncbi:hypothetical protein SUGI_0073050 [Cryptomeria japonica]|nr:hypothetical protein SUGI_0073050 [Cryptomeria japonica]
MTLEEEKTESGKELMQQEKYNERKGCSHGDDDNTNLGRSRSRSRSRSPSRINTLIGSLYTPFKSLGKDLKSSLIMSAKMYCHKLKEEEHSEEIKGRSNGNGDNNNLTRSRSRIKTLIGSLYTPLKGVGKELKDALITSAQIYCYTCASYYHFLLHLLGSAAPLPPLSITQINGLVLNVNGGHGKLANHDPCSTCTEESQLNQEMGMMVPCGHRFHGHCISKLLENNNCCPLCILILHDANATMSGNENQREQ